jgi:hypothetical protein
MAFIAMMREGNKSYWCWARSLTAITGIKVSKQAIFKRMNSSWVELVKTLLAKVMTQLVLKEVKHKLFKGFTRVLLQDSTTISLPKVMLPLFKGNVSRGKQKSVAKVNVVMDLLTGLCPVFGLMGFTVNEQALSNSILSIAQKGDLVIRDLGYFVLGVFKKMDEDGIYFLSRLRYNVGLYDIKSGKKLELTKLLKGKSWIDIEALCGQKEKLKVRVVAIKLSAEQAAERRRKAKKDRDKRLNHDEYFYELLDYVIFVTNVNNETWNYKEVAAAYRVRWNIEILFKSWKSGFKIEDMIPEDILHMARIESFIYLMLLHIAWFQLLIIAPFRWAIIDKYGKQLSMIKTAKYVMTNLSNWLFEAIGLHIERELACFCCYDKRSKPNAIEALERFYKPLS